MFSENIKNLLENITKPDEPESMTLVCEGGAFLGAYQNGALQVVREMERQEYVKVNRISGVSVGALNAFMYSIDRLDILSDTINIIKEDIREHYQITKIKEILFDIINTIDDDVFDSLQNKLYITYYSLDTCKQVVCSSFQTREKLVDVLLSSCNIPLLMKDISNSEIKTFDGITPFIFPQTPNEKCLFLSLTHMDWMKYALFSRGEETFTARIMHGILDAYEFFHKKKATKICSFVNSWSLRDYITFYGKEYIGFWFIYMIMVGLRIIEILDPYIKDTAFTKHTGHILLKIYSSILSYIVQ